MLFGDGGYTSVDGLRGYSGVRVDASSFHSSTGFCRCVDDRRRIRVLCKSVWFDSVPVIDPQVPPPTPPLPGFCKYPDICLYIN